MAAISGGSIFNNRGILIASNMEIDRIESKIRPGQGGRKVG
jgi:hypothetical protein